MLELSDEYLHENVDGVDVYVHITNDFMSSTLKEYWIEELVNAAKTLKMKNIFIGSQNTTVYKDTLHCNSNVTMDVSYLSTINIEHPLTDTQNTFINVYDSILKGFTPAFKISINSGRQGVYLLNSNSLFLYALHYNTHNKGIYTKIVNKIKNYGLTYNAQVIGVKLIEASKEDLKDFDDAQQKQLVELYKEKISELNTQYNTQLKELTKQQLIPPPFLQSSDLVRINGAYMAILKPIKYQTTKMIDGSITYNVSSLTKAHNIQVGVVLNSKCVVKAIKLYTATGSNEFIFAHHVGDAYMGGLSQICLGSFATRIYKKLETQTDLLEVITIVKEILSCIDLRDYDQFNISTKEELDIINNLEDDAHWLNDYEISSWSTE